MPFKKKKIKIIVFETAVTLLINLILQPRYAIKTSKDRIVTEKGL